jgi:hypothetical protein
MRKTNWGVRKLIQPDPGLRPHALDVTLQPQSMQQLAEVMVTRSSLGPESWVITGGYKLRCVAPCPGHVGYLLCGSPQ